MKTTTCYDYAINYLYRFPKTEQELRIKLYQKWYSTNDVAFAMENLKKQWFLDDQKFAESYVRSELVNKGKPAIVIIKKLQEKWIVHDLVKSVMTQYQEEINEWIHGRIRKEIDAYKKKWVEWFDIIQKLMRKWYKLNDIKDVIKN